MFPLTVSFFNGLDGITYTNTQIAILTISFLFLALLVKQVTKHNFYAICLLSVIFAFFCISRPAALIFYIPYLAITVAPYVMAFQEARHANT
jgi:hypothetical protein